MQISFAYPSLRSRFLHRVLFDQGLPWDAIHKLVRQRRIRLHGLCGLVYPSDLYHPVHYQDYIEVIGQNPTFQAKEFKLPSPELAVSKLNEMIVGQNEHVVLLNKLSGISTQGDLNLDQNLYYLLQSARPTSKIGIVHRLDKAASGSLIVSKTLDSAIELNPLMGDREHISKVYLALVEGTLTSKKGRLEGKIQQRANKKMTVSQSGKSALTLYKVIDQFQNTSLLMLKIREGRKHQIRVQLAQQLGRPVLNDCKYGGRRVRDNDSIYLHSFSYRLKTSPLLTTMLQHLTLNLANGTAKADENQLWLKSKVPEFWGLSRQQVESATRESDIQWTDSVN